MSTSVIMDLARSSLALGVCMVSGTPTQIQKTFTKMAKCMLDLGDPLTPVGICNLLFENWGQGYIIIAKEHAHLDDCHRSHIPINLAAFDPATHALVIYVYPALQAFFLQYAGDAILCAPRVSSVGPTNQKMKMVCISW